MLDTCSKIASRNWSTSLAFVGICIRLIHVDTDNWSDEALIIDSAKRGRKRGLNKRNFKNFHNSETKFYQLFLKKAMVFVGNFEIASRTILISSLSLNN